MWCRRAKRVMRLCSGALPQAVTATVPAELHAFVWQMRVCAEMVLLIGICFVFSVTRVVFDLHVGRRWRCLGAASRLLWIVALAASVVPVDGADHPSTRACVASSELMTAGAQVMSGVGLRRGLRSQGPPRDTASDTADLASAVSAREGLTRLGVDEADAAFDCGGDPRLRPTTDEAVPPIVAASVNAALPAVVVHVAEVAVVLRHSSRSSRAPVRLVEDTNVGPASQWRSEGATSHVPPLTEASMGDASRTFGVSLELDL